MAKKRRISLSQKDFKDITFTSFLGIKNKGLELDTRYPYFILNMDVFPDGSLKSRYKLKKVADLPYAHSPFRLDGNNYLVFSYQSGFDYLYKFSLINRSLKQITKTSSSFSKFYFVRIEDRVYISNKFWNGVYSIKDETVGEWKFDKSFTFESAKDSFEYAVSEAIPMPRVENLCFFKGRIFGSKENQLWFTEALYYDLVLPYFYFEFPEDINIVISNNEVIIISTNNRTYIGVPVEGETFNLQFNEYNIGSIKGSGILLNNNIPVWLSNRGLVMVKGTEPILFTKDRLDVNIKGEFVSGKANTPDGDKFLLGSERNNVDFKDEIITTVIKKEKNE